MDCTSKRRHACALLLALLLLLGCLPAHGENTVHLYLGIPFETGTVEMVTDILAKEKNATFEMNPNGVLTGYACNIEEYGYLFDLSIDFSDGQPQTGYSFESDQEITRFPPTIERIRLNSLQNARITPEEGQERIPADIRQYIDMVAQLTQQYGQPDIQYFKSSRMDGNKTILYQFADGQWHPDLMQQVVDNDKRLIANTYWGNVALILEVDLAFRYQDVYTSSITLNYYQENNIKSFLDKYTFGVYPIDPT